MSATMAAEPVAAFLRNAPIMRVPGRTHPIAIAYAPGAALADAVRDVAAQGAGQILCFLPGAPEIDRALPAVQATMAPFDAEVVPLHGGLEAEEQDHAVAPADRRRVILATNIAETSLTVPGVTAVVDTGLHKVARYDPDRAIDSLELERISRDSADQRAGRAGRVAPGIVRRLWSRTDRLREHREADIHRIDLSGPLLDILGWGGDPRTFEWFEAPEVGAIDAALDLLTRLGATADGRVTPLGAQMQHLPLHPRLARILLEAHGSRDAALACALLSERHFLSPRTAATTSDLLSAVEREQDLPPHVARVARELQRLVASHARPNEEQFRRALLAGYPDRVAKRRSPGSPRLLLASGHGGVLGPESGVVDAEYVVAIDVQAGRRGAVVEARVRAASSIERAWLTATDVTTHHELDPSGVVRAVRRDRYGAIVLAERPAEIDPQVAATLVANALLARGLGNDDERLLRRLRFAGLEVDREDLVRRAAAGCRRVDDVDLARELSWETKQALERLAPGRITVPSGRSHPLDYRDDGAVVASVKLQELFGLAETPRIGPRREPILFALLAPNGRPVQTTRDLRSFWANTYPEVRKELRGRYPRHPWPDDPWSATPTARTRKRE
jgi:ATP-dependent helicase HrpB